MFNSKKLWLFFISLLVTIPLSAQDFSIYAEIRPRYENRSGYGTMRSANDLQDNPASFVSQRSRFSFLYASDSTQKLRAGISFQDVRTWGCNATNKYWRCQ